MIRLRAVLLLCGVLIASPAFGASPDPKDLIVPPEELSKARELIRRLGSESYREREEASAQLAKLGRAAKNPLNEAVVGDPDPEIRLRASRLLPKAAAEDLKARIDTFLADTDGKFDHDLPGLKTFRKQLGATEKARALYVEILKSPYNLEMFAAIDKGDTEGGRAIADRRAALWNDMQGRQVAPGSRPFVPKQPTLSDIAALLYAEILISSENIPRTSTWTWINGTQFIQQSASIQALNSGSNVTHAEIYRTIVQRWLSSRTDPMELTNLSYQLGNGVLRNFKESQMLLRRIVVTEGVQNYAKQQALNWLIQQRGKEETKFFQAIMKNELRVGDYPDVFPNEKNPDRTISLNNDQMIQQVWFQRNNGQAEMHACLMKDVALAFLITEAKGNLKDYGFEMPPGVMVTPGQLGFGQYAFTSDAKRTEGFMKWGWKQLKDNTDAPAPKDTPKESPKDAPKDTPKDDVKQLPPTGVVKPAPAPVKATPAPAVDLPAPAPAATPKPNK